MAGRAEIIGRHPGDDRGLAALIKVEQLTVGPGVGAVHRYKDGDVANDLDAFVVGIFLDRVPLFEKLELKVLLFLDLRA